MNNYYLIWLISFVFGSTHDNAHGQLMGMTSFDSGAPNKDAIWSIDTGAGRVELALDLPILASEGGLAVDPGGVLYAAIAAFPQAVLITIAPQSGEAFSIGGIGFIDVSGLAFDSDGTLYGYDDWTCQLISIDIDTGQGTAIGPIGFEGGGGLAFSPDGTLYAVGGSDIECGETRGASLYRVDTLTGLGIEVGKLGYTPEDDAIVYVLGLEFIGDTLYLSAAGCVNLIGALYTVDTETGSAAFVGRHWEHKWEGNAVMGGLAFLPGPGDADRDDDTDLADFTRFQDCLTGPLTNPDGPELPIECRILDHDKDRDIDLIDFADFQTGFTAADEN